MFLSLFITNKFFIVCKYYVIPTKNSLLVKCDLKNLNILNTLFT